MNMMKLRRTTFRFGTSKNTLVYLQNSGEWNGNEFSSSVFSCNESMNTVESLFNHAANFIYRTYRDYPIRWKDIIAGKILHNENIEGTLIGDEIRDKCAVIDDINFNGGFVGGGKTGASIVQLPDLTENHLPIIVKGKKDFLMTICHFDGEHKCEVELRKGNLEDVRNYQETITRLVINQEKQKWEKAINKDTPKILQRLLTFKPDKMDGFQ